MAAVQRCQDGFSRRLLLQSCEAKTAITVSYNSSYKLLPWLVWGCHRSAFISLHQKKKFSKKSKLQRNFKSDLMENVPISSRLKPETLSDVPQLKGTYTQITQLE